MCTNAKIYDTICGATQIRQEESARLTAACDIMIVVADIECANMGGYLQPPLGIARHI